MTLRQLVRDIIPPLFRRAIRGGEPTEYQGVSSVHDLSALATGKFGAAVDAFGNVDPHVRPDDLRLRIYFLYLFASLAPRGQVVCAGISYGVAARILYELMPDRQYYLIDPLTGADESLGVARPTYNQSLEYVMKQYPANATVQFVRRSIPDCFPMASLKPLAFVHLNTGVTAAEVASLPYLFDQLTPGGFIVIDRYAFGRGHRTEFDSVIAALGTQSFTLPTGQGVVHKT